MVLEKIIKAANLTAEDFVIEIGPGEGILTEELVKRTGKVVAIEIDKNLAGNLKNKYKNNPKMEIINADILKINLPEIISNFKLQISNQYQNPNDKNTKCQILATKYKLIANIPYYITSPIIQLFLETTYPPTEMILMVQKEVAERICAEPGKMSILAVSVQYYADARLLFHVDKKSFWPIPEVDSAVIKIEVRSKNKEVSKEETKAFFRIVKAGFSARRKMLVNNLASSFHLDKREVEEKLKKAGVDPTARAQELNIEEWKRISLLF